MQSQRQHADDAAVRAFGDEVARALAAAALDGTAPASEVERGRALGRAHETIDPRRLGPIAQIDGTNTEHRRQLHHGHAAIPVQTGAGGSAATTASTRPQSWRRTSPLSLPAIASRRL